MEFPTNTDLELKKKKSLNTNGGEGTLEEENESEDKSDNKADDKLLEDKRSTSTQTTTAQSPQPVTQTAAPIFSASTTTPAVSSTVQTTTQGSVSVNDDDPGELVINVGTDSSASEVSGETLVNSPITTSEKNNEEENVAVAGDEIPNQQVPTEIQGQDAVMPSVIEESPNTSGSLPDVNASDPELNAGQVIEEDLNAKSESILADSTIQENDTIKAEDENTSGVYGPPLISLEATSTETPKNDTIKDSAYNSGSNSDATSIQEQSSSQLKGKSLSELIKSKKESVISGSQTNTVTSQPVANSPVVKAPITAAVTNAPTKTTVESLNSEEKVEIKEENLQIQSPQDDFSTVNKKTLTPKIEHIEIPPIVDKPKDIMEEIVKPVTPVVEQVNEKEKKQVVDKNGSQTQTFDQSIDAVISQAASSMTDVQVSNTSNLNITKEKKDEVKADNMPANVSTSNGTFENLLGIIALVFFILGTIFIVIQFHNEILDLLESIFGKSFIDTIKFW